jgi:imidazolonepropionase-like amidohydrolase
MARLRTARAGIRACVLVAALLSLHACARAREGAIPDLPMDVRSARVLALAHVRLIDGTGAPARDDQTIVIAGDRIYAVGPSSEIVIPPGAEIRDLRGHTVLPGFVQLHEHTWLGGIAQPVHADWSAALYLRNGVTTAMTAGTRFAEEELLLKQRVDAGEIPGPDFIIAGPYITGFGNPATSPNRVVRSEAEARAVVNEWADRGVTWFKILNGPLNVVRWVVDAAHARGARVTIHPCSVSLQEAADAGVDLIQHGFITGSEYVPGRRAGECPPGNQVAQADVDVSSASVQRSIRELAASGVAVVSTLAVYETFVPSFSLDTVALAALPASIRIEVEKAHAARAASGYEVPPRLLRKMMEWERAFVAAGGLLTAGSDPWGTGLIPGFGNLRQLDLLISAGFSEEEAVRIMTLNGALALGKADQIGTVEVGKIADIAVVPGFTLTMQTTPIAAISVIRRGSTF